MALEITGNIKVVGGLEVPTSYCRVLPTLLIQGNKINVAESCWLNKTKYEEGEKNIQIISDFNAWYEYDRNTDGEDILLFVSNEMKSRFEGMGYSVNLVDI